MLTSSPLKTQLEKKKKEKQVKEQIAEAKKQ